MFRLDAESGSPAQMNPEKGRSCDSSRPSRPALRRFRTLGADPANRMANWAAPAVSLTRKTSRPWRYG